MKTDAHRVAASVTKVRRTAAAAASTAPWSPQQPLWSRQALLLPLLLLLLLLSTVSCTELISLCSNDRHQPTGDGLLTFNTAGLLREPFQCNCTITFPNSTARDAGFLDVIMLKDGSGGSGHGNSNWAGSVGSRDGSAPSSAEGLAAGGGLSLAQTKRRPREMLNIGNNTCTQRPCYMSLRRNGSTLIFFSNQGGSAAAATDYGGSVIVGFRKARTSSDKPQSTIVDCRTSLFKHATAGAGSASAAATGAAHGGDGRLGAGERSIIGYQNVVDSSTIKLITLGTACGIVVFFLLIVIVSLSMLYHKARKQPSGQPTTLLPPAAYGGGEHRRGSSSAAATAYAMTKYNLASPFSTRRYSFSEEDDKKRKVSYADVRSNDAFPPPPPPIRGGGTSTFNSGGYYDHEATLPAAAKLEYL